MNFRPTTLLAAALLLAAPAGAAMLRVPIEDIAAESETVFRGRVVATESRWLEEPHIIVTDVTLRPTEVWAGRATAGAPITVRVNGGQVGDVQMIQEHEPVFRVDEDVVLFVRTATADLEPDGARSLGRGFLRVSAIEQGKFQVAGESVLSFRHEILPLGAFRARVQQLARSRGR